MNITDQSSKVLSEIDEQLKQRDTVSDTPRTDAETFINEGDYVTGDFARQLERELAAVAAERDALKAEQESTLKILKDGTAVHINMLRGTIATPTKEQLLHVIGDQRLCTAQSELSASQQEAERLRKIADALLNHCDKEGGECSECGKIVCPHGEPLHFHHDGCPACATYDAALCSTPAPARTDTERLDWLEKNQTRIFGLWFDNTNSNAMPKTWSITANPTDSFSGGENLGEGEIIRAAIDSAIDAEIERTKGAK